MTLDQRIKQIARPKNNPKLNLTRAGSITHDCIHRQHPGALITTLVVSRHGTYHGGRV